MAPHFFLEDVSVESIAIARQAYETGDLRERLKRHHGDNVDAAFYGWNRAWLDPKFRDWDITEYLPHIRVPALLIQGEDDEYGTLDHIETYERLVAAPVERLVLEKLRPLSPARPARGDACRHCAVRRRIEDMTRYSSLPLLARPHVPGSGSEPDRAPLEVAKADEQAFRYGVDLYNRGFFWEAHEVWEAVWLAAPPNSGRRQGVRALIQMANAVLKRDMKKPRGLSAAGG